MCSVVYDGCFPVINNRTHVQRNQKFSNVCFVVYTELFFSWNNGTHVREFLNWRTGVLLFMAMLFDINNGTQVRQVAKRNRTCVLLSRSDNGTHVRLRTL